MKAALVLAMVGCSASASKPVTAPPVSPPNVVASNASAPAAKTDPKPPAFRLPGDVVPVRYRLDQRIVPGHASANGDIRIDATVKRATRVVWLNARDIEVEHATIDGHAARVIPGDPDFVGLAADRDLVPGPVLIDVSYNARIDTDKSRGIYSEREGNQPYVYTFFEPIDARRAFPCFDEPEYKVPWTLVFHVRSTDIARGNAPVVREVDEGGGMKRVELAESKPIPSYLVAFVVGPFEVVDGGSAGRVKTPIAFIVPKGREGELGYAKEITPKVVAALEDYFDMPYPYVKLDVAVVPRYWGTMEHPGIVAMGQPLTLIRPDQATRGRKQSYANILAHELSHYWFGDYVTLAWWDDTWLNESLGEWSDLNITDAAAPEWHVREDRLGLSTSSMRADETLAAPTIHHAVTTNEEIEASFDNGIAYGKGSSVIRAAEALVGPEKWRAFIRAYVRAHAFGVATANDFVGGVRTQLGDEAADMLATYIAKPGVPVVQATIDCGGKVSGSTLVAPTKLPSIRISEPRRSLPAGATDPAPFAWNIPVCVRYGDASVSETACGTQVLPAKVCPTWVIPNADANGYYRSIVTAKPPPAAAKPTTAERMMWFSDLRAMVERGELTIDSVLAAIPALARDPDPRIARWSLTAADLPFGGLDEPLYRASRAWIVRVFGPRARELGWQRGKTDDDDRHKLRQLLLRTVARDDAALRAQAEKLADRWLADRTGIPDDMVDSVLAAAAHDGDAARFDRMLAAAKAGRDRTETHRLLAALAAFTDPALENRALSLTLGSDFDLRESVSILQGALAQHETRTVALAFIHEHIDAVLAHMRSDEASWLLGEIAGVVCTPDQRTMVAAMVTPRAAVIDGAQNAVAQGLEESDRCIAEATREKPALEAFFRSAR